MNLSDLQAEHRKWLKHNFPDQQHHDGLLGLIEELGELAHAHLKGQQGIRHTPAEILNMKADAVGDIVIYLASYCNTNNLNLAYCVDTAWQQVKRRDWRANPQDAAQLALEEDA